MKLNLNFKNTISLFSFEFIARLLGFLAVTYLARVLGKSSFGIINIGLAVLSYTMIFGSSGLNLLGTRKILSKNENPGIIGEIITARIYLSVLVYSAACILVFFIIDSPEIISVILVYNLFLFPSAFLLEWFFQGYQRMDVISIGRIAGAAGYLLLVLLVVKNPGDTVLTGIAWTGGGIINSILLFYYFRSYDIKLGINLKDLRCFRLIKESFSLGIAAAITSFVLMFPVIFLGISAGTAEAGLYSAASKIVILLLVFDRVFTTLFFPKVVRYFNESPQSLNDIFSRSVKIISFFALSVSILSAVCAGFFIVFVFGERFAGAVLPFRVLNGFFALTLINSVYTYTLIGTNREKIYTASVFIGMIVFIIGTLFLTQMMGTAGPAAAMILFELTSLIFMHFKISKDISFNLFGGILIPAAAAAVIIYLLISLKIALVVQLVLTFLIGIPVIALLTGFRLKEVKFLKRIFA